MEVLNSKKPLNEDVLSSIEILFLTLMIVSLPSLEAPKNIFLVLFVFTATIRQLFTKTLHTWNYWDWIFSSFIGCALLSTMFAGFSTGKEWGGFRMLLTYTCTGWLVYRARYSERQVSRSAWIIIISTIPPLVWGLIQYLFLHTKPDLQLHSVGHVNHSAIYLSIIYGAALSSLITYWDQASRKLKLTLFTLTLCLFLGIVIGHSRAATGVAVITTIALIIYISSSRMRRKFLIVASILLTIPFFIDTTVIQKQLTNQANHDTLSGRDMLWNSCIEISRMYPIAGIGMNNWKSISLEDIKVAIENRGESYNPNSYILFPGHAHSVYFQTLVERGLIGLTSLLVLMFVWARELVKEYKNIQISSTKRFLWGASLSAWLTTFIIGCFNSTFHHENGILAALFLSLFLSVFKASNQR